MDIRQLQYFLALSRQEHISNTAEFLNISQPALSKSISALEKEIGLPLFDRLGNRIRLNDSGRAFAIYARNALDSLETGLATVRQGRYDIQGEVRITCHAFADILTDCLDGYVELNPRVRLQIFQSQLGDDRFSDRVDFLLGTDRDADLMRREEELRSWVPQPLLRDEIRILISPRYRWCPADRERISMADLKEETFLTDALKTTFYYDNNLFRLAAGAGFLPEIFCRTDDFLTKVHFLDAGKGIMLLPASCLRTVRRLSPDVRDYGIEGVDTTRTIYLIRKRRSLLSEAALDFWAFVLDFYGVEDTSEI